MPKDFLRDVLEKHIAEGSDNTIWWDEERIPLHTIDQRVTDVMSLKGRKAVVTGGAGINLGQAIVHRLAGLGADVAIVDQEPEKAAALQESWGRKPGPSAEELAKIVADRWGVQAVGIYGDALDPTGIRAILAEANERLGRIDILVNSAVATYVGDLATVTPEQIDSAIAGTLAAPIHSCRAVLDYMIPQGYGRIVNIGSEASRTVLPDLGLYGTLKAGVAEFTKHLGKEVAQHGVFVNGVNAGSMWGPNRELLPDTWQVLYDHGRTAIQRYQLPEEVANMIAFLASDAASSIVGTTVDVGGGMSL
ncbi:SDR family oxidoreductase [Pseudonocardia sp. NPDC049154]|uniref:SDR family NAD(P)-dependent oxidoreductase n=1 Tax=Pseudonocardia sp. NPDC049154 TaxID=3155501 RepID=UPI0033ED021A